MKRYNELGIEALGDGRRHNRGAEALISDIEQAQLWQVLRKHQMEDSGMGSMWLIG